MLPKKGSLGDEKRKKKVGLLFFFSRVKYLFCFRGGGVT